MVWRDAALNLGSKPMRARTSIGLFVIALIFRLSMLVIPANRDAGDQSQYLELAQNLRTYGVFGTGDVPRAHRPPLYPAILAVIGPTGVQVLQMAAGSALAPLTFAIASLLMPPAGALSAGLAMALAPMSSRYCTLYMTETLFTFLLALGMFFWMIRKPVAGGICFGLATLLRAVLFPFLLVLPLLALRRAWRSAVIVSVTAIAVIAPWTLRDYFVVHHFVPVASAGWGSNLFQGTLDVPRPDPWPFIMRERAGDMEEALLKRGVQRIRENPGRWLVVRAKQYLLLYIDDSDYIRASWKPFFLAGNIALLVLAVLGAWRLRPGPPVWVFPAFLAVSQLPMWTEARYSLPAVPFLVIMAAGLFAGPGGSAQSHEASSSIELPGSETAPARAT